MPPTQWPDHGSTYTYNIICKSLDLTLTLNAGLLVQPYRKFVTGPGNISPHYLFAYLISAHCRRLARTWKTQYMNKKCFIHVYLKMIWLIWQLIIYCGIPSTPNNLIPARSNSDRNQNLGCATNKKLQSPFGRFTTDWSTYLSSQYVTACQSSLSHRWRRLVCISEWIAKRIHCWQMTLTAFQIDVWQWEQMTRVQLKGNSVW